MQDWHQPKKSQEPHPRSMRCCKQNTATSAAYFLHHVLPATRSTRAPPLAVGIQSISNTRQHIWCGLSPAVFCMCERSTPDHLSGEPECVWKATHYLKKQTLFGVLYTIPNILQCTDDSRFQLEFPKEDCSLPLKCTPCPYLCVCDRRAPCWSPSATSSWSSSCRFAFFPGLVSAPPYGDRMSQGLYYGYSPAQLYTRSR